MKHLLRHSAAQPPGIILVSILAVFVISRLIAYLVIAQGSLPHSLFVRVHGFRLHHFVYGNLLILITSFLAIAVNARVNRNWLALFYGIGLGLVLDEFPLWMGDISQLNGYVVIIPYAPWAVLAMSIVLVGVILFKRKLPNMTSDPGPKTR